MRRLRRKRRTPPPPVIEENKNAPGSVRHEVALPWGPVSYLEWNPEAETTILLLHGGMLDNAELSWGHLGGVMAGLGYRVLAPDHPGYGHSPLAPWTATQERLVEYTGELVTAFGLSDYIIGGISMGGGMTIGHVLDHPGEVKAMMLFDSYGMMRQQYIGNPLISLMRHNMAANAIHLGLFDSYMASAWKDRASLENGLRRLLVNHDQLTDDLVDLVYNESTHGHGLEVFGQWQHDQYRGFRLKTSYRYRMDEITCPTLIVHGEQDEAVLPIFARWAARELPDVRLEVLEHAGHWVQRDAPERVDPIVTEFLSALPH
ncbi:alpha/beta fold hydrolase [Granulicoccus phenolivorans]|uniref:alpha/beta fold hydrolase n=1 Tax=Granulicoccus phenolivorans TaxID=266854 RepID=UPI000400C859|nr:alpha/beta hydrolase [Granulicoccus phenolivorans]